MPAGGARGGARGGRAGSGGQAASTAAQSVSHAQSAFHGLNGSCKTRSDPSCTIEDEKDKTDWSKRMNPRARRVLKIALCAFVAALVIILTLAMCAKPDAPDAPQADASAAGPIERIDRGAKQSFQVKDSSASDPEAQGFEPGAQPSDGYSQ